MFLQTFYLRQSSLVATNMRQQKTHDYHGVMRHAILSHQVVRPRLVALGMDVSYGLMIVMKE
jgi:hypothetical protein